MMKKFIALVAGMFLLLPVAYAGNNGVSNTVTGAPGNSSAAHSSTGDTNCVGDFMSYRAKTQNGVGHGLSGGSPGSVTEFLSYIVTLGSTVYGDYQMDCAAVAAGLPPPPPPPPPAP